MRMRPMPRATWSRLTRARISRCVVTSSAELGSSAMSRSGSRARAAAIATRWRMPPESWNGYRSTTLSSVIPTSASRLTTSWRRSARDIRRRSAGGSDSSMVRPHRDTGLRIVNGFCMTRPMRRPRTFCHSRSRSGSRSTSSKVAFPWAARPRGSRPISALAVMDLPLPDSPTMATDSPGPTARSMPDTIVRSTPTPPVTCRSATRRPRRGRATGSAAVTASPRGSRGAHTPSRPRR